MERENLRKDYLFQELDDMTIAQFGELVDLKGSTLRTYLSRAEFNHITTYFKYQKKYFSGVTNYDVKLIRRLASGRQKNIGTGRWK